MKLKKINLKNGDSNIHPDIKTNGTFYLAKIEGRFFAGTFSVANNFSDDEPFLSFDGWYGAELQYDKPGTNKSDWQELWEIVENG